MRRGAAMPGSLVLLFSLAARGAARAEPPATTGEPPQRVDSPAPRKSPALALGDARAFNREDAVTVAPAAMPSGQGAAPVPGVVITGSF